MRSIIARMRYPDNRKQPASRSPAFSRAALTCIREVQS